VSVDPFSDKAAEDFLSGGGVAAKWPTVGYVVEGTVTDWRMAQQTDYDSGELLYWVGNKRIEESKVENKNLPVMQLILEIRGEPTGETWEGLQNERVELEDDDGTRVMYIRGGLLAAFRNEMKKTQSKLEKGAYVRVERIKDGSKSNPKYQAPHRYTVQWTKPENNEKIAEQLLDSPTPFDEE